MTPQYMSVAAKLATLDDPGLAKYAEVNKEDAILLGLAMAERSRREAVRNAGKASVQAAQGPKVVDTEIANMAMQAGAEQPTAGLSALAAPTRMAYNGGVMRMRDGGSSLRPLGPMIRESVGEIGPLGRLFQRSRSAFGDAFDPSQYAPEYQKEALAAIPKPLTGNVKEQPIVPAPPAPSSAEAAGLSALTEEQIAAMRAAAEAAEKGQVGGLPAVVAAAPEKAKEAAGLTALPAAATAAVPYKARTFEEIEKEFAGQREQSQKFLDLVTQGNKAILSQAEANAADARKRIEERGVFGTEREAELKAEITGLKEKEAKNVNLALVQAGFAMMAGDAPTVLQNIGMGALVGTKAYKEGMEKIDNKRDKLREAIFDIEKVRRGEKIADDKELGAINDRLLTAQKDLFKTQTDVAGKLLGWSRDDFRAAQQIASREKGTEVTAGLRAQEIQARRADTASRERIAGMPGATERMYAALADPNSPVAKGLANYAKAMGKDKGASMADYAKFAALPSNAALSDAEIIKKFLGTYGLISGGLRAPAPVSTPGDGQIRE